MHFSNEIISWYHKNKRDLPWRNTKDPYKIWLSEIILQQTRVDQGLSYYLSFIQHFPTVQKLACANEEKVLKLWQGLGYYSRARNLHYTAKQIHSKHNGIFPNSYEEIIKLKGVGEYTAAAIASFCYSLPHPVIDGNVYRVLSRVFGIKTPIDTTPGKKEFKSLAEQLLDVKSPSDYNQAIMEFGAIQCTPKKPNCSICPIKGMCLAHSQNLIKELPVKAKKTKQKNRFFNYLVIKTVGDHVFLNKREKSDIWKSLYEFPMIETGANISFEKLTESSEWNNFFPSSINPEIKITGTNHTATHILSHQKIHARFIEINLDSYQNKLLVDVPIKKISQYPVPKLLENYILQKFQ